jgi:hypothetical protein
MPLVGIWRREEQWSGTWRCEGALNSRSMLGCALGCRWECPALPVACRRRLLSWLFGRALPHSPVNHAKAEREKSSAGLPACGEREHASLRQGQQGVAVLHFLKMRREAQRGKEEREGGAKVYSMRARASVASALASSPPACLKVHTTSYHFLGNGKIRRFGCSLLFSGVASVTHCGLFFALCGL